MKKKLLMIFLVVCVGMASLAWAGLLQQRLKVVLARKSAAGPNDFVFTVTTVLADTFTPPIYTGGTYDFTIDCGGGTGGGEVTSYDDPSRVCNYAEPATYTITIAGTIIGWRFNDGGDKLLMRDIISWGPLKLGNQAKYFKGCTNLTVSATDVLDLTGITTLLEMFEVTGLTSVPSINDWDFSSVTILTSMFENATSFDQDLGVWDISNVTAATKFLDGVTLSTSNYDSLLIGWEANSHQNNVIFHGGNSKYSAGTATTARAALETDGWTITDGGQE